MERLYSDYRGEAYFSMRHAWEPSYTPDMNVAFGYDSVVVHMRQTQLTDALTSAQDLVPRNSILSALDVGGDMGQFLPSWIPTRLVLDPSNRPLSGGVMRISSLEDLKNVQVDLLIMMGVLEHLRDPGLELQQVLEALPEPPKLLLISVPSGVPQSKESWWTYMTSRVGALAARQRYLWSILDTVSTVRIGTRRPFRRLMPFRQSEHLTFFNRLSLLALCQRLGLHVVAMKEVSVPSQLGESGRLQFSQDLFAVCRP
jgi:hypothetical protein